MFNDIFCDRYDNKDEFLKNANILKTFAGRFGLGNGHLLDQVLRKSGILPRTVHKEPGTTLRKKCCWNSQKADILSSVQRLHCPGVSWKVKGRGKLSIYFAADQDKVDTIYRIILSVNQLSVYGAVAAICEEFEGHQDRSGEPEILMVNRSLLVKSKQKFLCKTKIQWMTKSYGSSTFNKLNRFHQKTE